MSDLMLCHCTVISGGYRATHPSCPMHGANAHRIIHVPEPSLPLSAIRALIQQWREEAASLYAMSNEYAERGDMEMARAWQTEAQMATLHANELEALCPAPAAEEEKSRTS